MATPKYTDPAVQNKTQDDASDKIDDLHGQPLIPGKEDNSKNPPGKTDKRKNTDSGDDKRKGYKEGTRNDDSFEEEDDSLDYNSDIDEDDREERDFSTYGKSL